MIKLEKYLGDGAYVRFDPSLENITIYTSNGVKITNQIHLGRDEIDILIKFLNPVHMILFPERYRGNPSEA